MEKGDYFYYVNPKTFVAKLLKCVVANEKYVVGCKEDKSSVVIGNKYFNYITETQGGAEKIIESLKGENNEKV